jgi:hypothetical protein
MEIADINKLKLARVKCMKSLLYHTRYFFMAQYKRKFVIGDHHKIICDALERVLTGSCKRLIINIAPRYGKTELAVKSLISHGLSLNPAAKFIHLSYSDDLAVDNSETVKELVNSAEYQQLFPEVKIKPNTRAKDKWYTTENGGVLARAAGGAVTGFGAGQVDREDLGEDTDMDEFLNGILQNGETELDKKWNFGGCVIIDDPIKPEDADQDTLRLKVNSRFDSTIRNRVNSRDTPIVIIMQRLHPEDLAGYLQREDEADKWEVISLPCLVVDENGELVQEENEKGDIETKKYRSLWPFKHTVQELMKLKKSNDLVFERQYQQDPNPKSGLMFPLKGLNFYDPEEMENVLDDPDYTYCCVDPANEGGDDFAAGPFKLIGDRIYLPEVLYNTDGTDFNEPEVTKMVLRNKPASTGVEGVMGWKETADRIRTDLENKDYQGEFRVLKPRTKKHTRIANRAAFIRNNMWFRKDYMKYPQYYKFMRNLTSYLKIQEAGKMNKHDDAPDLCEMAAVHFERNFPSLWGGIKN